MAYCPTYVGTSFEDDALNEKLVSFLRLIIFHSDYYAVDCHFTEAPFNGDVESTIFQ